MKYRGSGNILGQHTYIVMELKDLQRDRLDRLVAKMKKGDRTAAGTLYEELAPKLYGFVFSRTGSREVAEDLSQEIFIKLIERVESFDDKKGRFTVWFWRMARNTLIDHYRQKKMTPFSHFEDDEVAGMAVGEIPDTDNVLAYRRLRKVVATFSREDQELFELRFAAEMSYRDIANILERPEGALRVAALRLRDKIKKEFKQDGHDVPKQ
jgi:RNA polymerase sigma-70 factor (ECF subfamily)